MVISHLSGAQGSSEHAANSSAANGVYVNLIPRRSCHV